MPSKHPNQGEGKRIPGLKAEAEFFLIQGASLALTLVAGFVLIRNLGVTGYGKYVLMVALGQMLSTLGNSGLFVGASQRLAESEKTDSTAARLFAAVSHLRLRFTLLAGGVVLAVSAVLLFRIGLTAYPLVGGILVSLCYGAALVTCSLYSEGLMLLGESKLVSRSDAGFGALAAFSSVLISSLLKDGMYVLFFLSLIELSRAFLMRRHLVRRIGTSTIPAPDDISFLRGCFWSLLPNVAFATTRTEFVKFALSIQGLTSTLGAFEGLRRFGRGIAPLYKYLTIVIVPRLTRSNDRRQYISICLRSLIFIFPPVLLFVAACHHIPGLLLRFLGSEFADYRGELQLVAWLLLLDLASRFLYDITRSRGWLYFHKRFEIPAFLFVLGASLFLLDFAQLEDVIYLNMVVLASSIFIALLDLNRGLRTPGSGFQKSPNQVPDIKPRDPMAPPLPNSIHPQA